MSLRIQAIVLFIVLGVVAAGWSMYGLTSGATTTSSKQDVSQSTQRQRHNSGSRPVPVIVAAITMVRRDESIIAIGSARARRHVMLRPRADGQLVAFPSKAGDYVQAGQLLFKLETTHAELAVQLAEKRLEDAERLLTRQQQLQQRQVASSAKVADNRMDVERAKLEVRQAQQTLQDLSVRAPFAGVIGLPSVEVGERVTTATEIVTLDDRRELLIEFKVPERYVALIQRGDPLEIQTPALQRQRFKGRVEYIDSRIETASRTMKVRGVIPNGKDMLRPGMSFVIEMLLRGKTYLSVPELALQWRKGEGCVPT